MKFKKSYIIDLQRFFLVKEFLEYRKERNQIRERTEKEKIYFPNNLLWQYSKINIINWCPFCNTELSGEPNQISEHLKHLKYCKYQNIFGKRR